MTSARKGGAAGGGAMGLAVGPQSGAIGAFDAGIDPRRQGGVAADARRDDLAERDTVWRRPGLGIPQLGAHDRAGAMEVAVLDVHARGEQRGLAERAERVHQLGIVVDFSRARHAQRLAGKGNVIWWRRLCREADNGALECALHEGLVE